MAAVDVPSPVPPDDRDAWYAPAVHAQYAVGHRVVVTIREGPDAFAYEVREPSLARPAQLDRVSSYFDEASVQPPLTRELPNGSNGAAPKVGRCAQCLSGDAGEVGPG